MSTQQTYAVASSAHDVFLESFRRHGAGVAIVTARKSSGEPTGFTATSLASLSSLPPRATFNMSQLASSYPAIRSSDYVLIHFLSAHNLDLARQFSGEASERFGGIELQDGPMGLPLLPGTQAYLVGKIVARHETGDAATIAVEITDGGLGEPGDSLVYQEKSYRVAASLPDA
jgi:flavin reductase (DIM6/NTAB) family NADH-FMN oxidoreductase RutF